MKNEMANKQMSDRLLEEISNYSWFKVKESIPGELIRELIKMHQERFKPFGLSKIVDCKWIGIWPGESPKHIIQMRMESKKSVIHMFIGNALDMVREIGVQGNRMRQIDMLTRQIESKIKARAHENAIESAGLTVRDTITLPIIKNHVSPAPEITDFDTVEKATEDAMATAAWHVSWMMVEDVLKQKGYNNPFSPIVELYKIGLWPVGVVGNEYIVLVPGGRRTEIF